MTASFEQRCAELAARLQALPDKPEETAAGTLSVLWHLANGQPFSVDAAREVPVPRLDDAGQLRLDVLIARRLSGVPLAHLSGRQRFMALEMLAGPQALIPRIETELLGHATLGLLRELAEPGVRPRVIDVCTGSGNLALALAQHVPQATIHASDLSSEAIELARRNAEHLGLADRVQWAVGDLLQPFDGPAFHGQVDLLVCNPPYISSQKVGTMPNEIADFEPRLAFDGGPLGVRILQRLMGDAPRFLRRGGWLAFEVGQGQGRAVLRRLQSGGAFAQSTCVTDEQGGIRAILAQR